jgi:predicted SnoaL-like aldol condensation-catalyzing enzyme
MPSSSNRRFAGTVLALALFCLTPLALAADTDVAKNKAVVQGFWHDVLIARNVDAAPRYLHPDYIQHNPHIPSGLIGFQNFFRKEFAQIPPDFKVEIVKTVAEGDLVVTYSQFSGTDPQHKPFTGTVFDMFRLQGGLIAEHWEQIEPES